MPSIHHRFSSHWHRQIQFPPPRIRSTKVDIRAIDSPPFQLPLTSSNRISNTQNLLDIHAIDSPPFQLPLTSSNRISTTQNPLNEGPNRWYWSTAVSAPTNCFRPLCSLPVIFSHGFSSLSFSIPWFFLLSKDTPCSPLLRAALLILIMPVLVNVIHSNPISSDFSYSMISSAPLSWGPWCGHYSHPSPVGKFKFSIKIIFFIIIKLKNNWS